MEPVEEKEPLGRTVRTGVGKLFLVLAGCGALGLVIFVLMPMLTEPPAPPAPPSPQEIVAEVMGEAVETAPEPEETQAEAIQEALRSDVGMAGDSDGESVMQKPSPLLAVRDNGEGVPAVVPRQEEPKEDATETAQGELPPPMSPEEIEAALPEPGPVAGPAGMAEGPAGAEMPQEPGLEAFAQMIATGNETLQRQGNTLAAEPRALTVVERPVGAAPSDVREVQGLLKELGFDPGPVDGVWGSRTTEAWKAFAREAGGLVLAAAGVSVGALSGDLLSPEDLEELKELEAQWEAEQATVHSESRPPSETPSPSEELSPGAAAGTLRAGNRQPDPPAEGVIVGRTLRGVMGYRMPLVSRQVVPDQVVSGVLIPAHTAFVILKPGYWELTGLTPEDVHLLKDAAARAEAEALAPQAAPEPVRRGWNPLRLFRKRQPTGGQ
ncbi:MAG: hypothetical protein OXU26_09290 [Acidobacteriota bacterium]|nr:hypothetical protein [Acidobacteriota bacterium]